MKTGLEKNYSFNLINVFLLGHIIISLHFFFYFFDVIASMISKESMDCMYEKVSRSVTFSGIHRNTQIIVMW
jgi:hypothetical protein